jgi:predicted PurR-regulated permease PerM
MTPRLVSGCPLPGQQQALPETPARVPLTPTAGGADSVLASIRRLLIAMLVLALLYTVCVAKPVLMPMLLAAFLAVCISPLVDLAQRLVPRLLAAIAVVALLLGAVVQTLSVLTAPAQDWLSHAPETLPRAFAKLREWLRTLGEASGTAPVLETVGSLSGSEAEGPAPAPWHWWELLLAAPPILIQAFSVILLMLFFVTYGGDLFRRAVEVLPTLTGKKQVVGIVRAIKVDTARYFLTSAAINVGLGTATAMVLWGWLWGIAGVILGVPLLMCLKLCCQRLPAWTWLARSIE